MMHYHNLNNRSFEHIIHHRIVRLSRLLPVRLAAVLLTGAAVCAFGSDTDAAVVSAHAEAYKYAADYISYDADGRACCIQDDGSRLSGKFSLQPNFLLGDAESDGIVDAQDAASILNASALSGLGVSTAESLLAQKNSDMCAEDMRLIADVNQDSYIDAQDASLILVHAALSGLGQENNPLGFAYYYADVDGYLQTGMITDAVTGEHYYAQTDYTLMTGWINLDENYYYADESGVLLTGWQVIDGEEYYFSKTGLLMPGEFAEEETDDVHASEDTDASSGTSTDTAPKKDYPIDITVREMLDNAERNPGKREITVYDRQHPENGEPVEFTIRLSDRDYEIIEAFAAEHFTPDMTLSECLYETWWWIHCNVDYAYAGEKWKAICNLSYPDAIFNHKSGQCVQYNGAMAAVLAYYGFDVYMVKGWTNPPKNTTQHYWTEVMIDGTRYYVETGNQGKNGDYWEYFFVDADTVNYTQK